MVILSAPYLKVPLGCLGHQQNNAFMPVCKQAARSGSEPFDVYHWRGSSEFQGLGCKRTLFTLLQEVVLKTLLSATSLFAPKSTKNFPQAHLHSHEGIYVLKYDSKPPIGKESIDGTEKDHVADGFVGTG